MCPNVSLEWSRVSPPTPLWRRATSPWAGCRRPCSPRPPPSGSSSSWSPGCPPPASGWGPPTPCGGCPVWLGRTLLRYLQHKQWLWSGKGSALKLYLRSVRSVVRSVVRSGVSCDLTWSAGRSEAVAPCGHPDYEGQHRRAVAGARLQRYRAWTRFLSPFPTNNNP